MTETYHIDQTSVSCLKDMLSQVAGINESLFTPVTFVTFAHNIYIY